MTAPVCKFCHGRGQRIHGNAICPAPCRECPPTEQTKPLTINAPDLATARDTLLWLLVAAATEAEAVA